MMVILEDLFSIRSAFEMTLKIMNPKLIMFMKIYKRSRIKLHEAKSVKIYPL